MKVAISGVTGRMGKTILSLLKEFKDMQFVGGIDKEKGFDYLSELPDVIIDFSNHSFISELLAYALKNSCKLVIGTTGYTEEEEKAIKDASNKIAIFKSSNMSIGINVMNILLKEAVEILGKDTDIEIIEMHHNKKKDAPSGTAKMFYQTIKEVLSSAVPVYGRVGESMRTKNEIGMHSIRAGGIFGIHNVIFAQDDEVFELKHTALSRRAFARGALKAVEFISKKEKGLYSMLDLLKEELK